MRSTLLTHTIDLMQDRYVAGSVVLGEYAVAMSGCMLLSGTQVPARSIIAAGSVISTKLTQELTFYRGNPAEAVYPCRIGSGSSTVVTRSASRRTVTVTGGGLETDRT